MCSMARPLHGKQTEARALRAAGWSLRNIAQRLEVSLSSASIWTRGVAVAAPPVDVSSNAVVRTKRCSRCHRVLEETAFHRSRERRTAWCKECRADYIRSRGELHLNQTRAARERRRAAARQLVLSTLASGRCADCKLRDPVVFEFDHIATKTAEISKLVHEGYRLARIEKELAGCVLVCANCHRRRTAVRKQAWRVDPDMHSVKRPLQRRNLRFLGACLQDSSCVDCGETDPVVLDFDHIGPKRHSVVWLAFSEYSIAALAHEIARCEIRCANCHRRRTVRGQPGHLRHHLLEPP
jgi:hypothetical protein